MNPAQYRKLPRHFTPSQTFVLDLTPAEAEVIGYLLPKGCSLTQQSKSKQKQNAQKRRIDQNMHSQHSSMMHNESSSNRHPIMKEYSAPIVNKKTAQKKPAKQQLPESVKPCVALLQQLKSYKHSWPFLEAVDAEALGIPEYYQIVAEPMDLSKVEQKLKTAQYKTPQQFYRDINLMIKNSYIFNQPNEEFVKLTADFEKYFWRIAGAEAKPSNDKKLQKEKQRQRERLEKQKLKDEQLKQKMIVKQKQKQRKLLLQQQQQAEQALRMARKKKKLIPKDILQAQNISLQEKLELAASIHNLPKEHLKGIRQIVFTDLKQQQAEIRVTNEFDIEKIGYKKIRELQRYVRMKANEMESTKFSDEFVEKRKEVDLDEMESEWSQEFVD